MATPSLAAGAYAAIQSLAPGSLSKPSPTPASPVLPGIDTGMPPASTPNTDFGSLVTEAINGAAQSGAKADTQITAAAHGKADIVDLATAIGETDALINVIAAARDRFIASYEDVMRMPV